MKISMQPMMGMPMATSQNLPIWMASLMVAEKCEKLMALDRQPSGKDVECNEICGFIQKKQKQVTVDDDPDGASTSQKPAWVAWKPASRLPVVGRLIFRRLRLALLNEFHDVAPL